MILMAMVAAALAFGCLGWFGGRRFERAGHTLRELLADTREWGRDCAAPPGCGAACPAHARQGQSSPTMTASAPGSFKTIAAVARGAG
jgi:hypothetical protein